MLHSPQHSATWQRRVFVGLLAVAGALVYSILLSDHGLGRYLELRKRLDDRGHVAFRRAERNRRLAERLERLRTDPHALEEAARSTLGVVGEDEIVLVFPDRRGSSLE